MLLFPAGSCHIVVREGIFPCATGMALASLGSASQAEQSALLQLNLLTQLVHTVGRALGHPGLFSASLSVLMIATAFLPINTHRPLNFL